MYLPIFLLFIILCKAIIQVQCNNSPCFLAGWSQSTFNAFQNQYRTAAKIFTKKVVVKRAKNRHVLNGRTELLLKSYLTLIGIIRPSLISIGQL